MSNCVLFGATDKRIACDEEFSDSEDEGEGGRKNVAKVAKRPRVDEDKKEGEEKKSGERLQPLGTCCAVSSILKESFVLIQKLKRKTKQRTAVQRRLTPKGDGRVPCFLRSKSSPVHWLNKKENLKVKLNCLISHKHFLQLFADHRVHVLSSSLNLLTLRIVN